MNEFRKRPLVIIAHRIGDDGWPDAIWDGVNRNEIILHLEGKPPHVTGYVEIETQEGTMRGDVGDWIICGVAGEFYPCKHDIFMATYEAALPMKAIAGGKNPDYRGPGMDFGQALDALKEGHRVQRPGWNGKGMFLFLVNGSTFTVNRAPLLGIYPEGTVIDYRSHIDMKTADGSVVPWVCSQTDALADDWDIIEIDARDAESVPADIESATLLPQSPVGLEDRSTDGIAAAAESASLNPARHHRGDPE